MRRNEWNSMKIEKKDFHVVPKSGKWAVELAGGLVEPDVFDTKGEALEYAREIAEDQHVCMVVHDEEGKFEEFDHDPKTKEQHVVHKDHHWAVIAAGGKDVSGVFPTKGAALAHAYKIATEHDVCMLVHDKHGKFKSVTCPPDGHPGILQVLRMKTKI